MKLLGIHIVLFCNCLIMFAQDSTTVSTPIPQKSPTMAIAYTVLCPGLGQVYVGSYWKAPIAAGAALFFAYQVVRYNDVYNEKTADYEFLLAQGLNPNDSRIRQAIREKEFYNNARDLNGLWLLGVYGLAAVDAYVGAHMLEFDVSDDLSFTITPDPLNGMGRIHACYQF
ncbi:MAG: hypothetical protein EBU66_00775 [Bacteroidetes bacterium]|nr:hypothetical protein [Bacteroidota bacterium]